MKIPGFLLALLLCIQNLFANTNPSILSPQPDSKYNKISTSILLRYEDKSLAGSLNKNSFSIFGSKSGSHSYSIKIAADNKTVIITPLEKFSTDEEVSFALNGNLKTNRQVSFSFQTEKMDLKPDVVKLFNDEINLSDRTNLSTQYSGLPKRTDTLPADFPNISVKSTTLGDPGYIFLANTSISSLPISPYLMILDDNANPIFYKKVKPNALDFKKQPNGNLTYFSSPDLKYYELDNHYNLVDSFYCGNGYTTDLHELRLLSNGHALLLGSDQQIVDMRSIIQNGDSAALVSGAIIQELDENKNVVFQWRSWDHFLITDATHENLTAHVIDYVHANALEIDNDGNILLSSRHMDEITKINRLTGETIWRLGGNNNQFNFLNDPDKFSHQHAIRRIANGHITLFDNGNFHSPSYSRAVEYNIDEQNKTIQLVWQFRNSPDYYSYAMGNVQRLDNGNTLIGWGAGSPSVTEVDPAGNKVLEFALPDGIVSYRAFKFDWDPASVNPLPQQGGIPASFNLYQNFPNPFNPSTTIKYDIPQNSIVKIVIYNSIGQKVQEIYNGETNAGTYEFIWNAGNFASGIYYCTIETNSYLQTKKMMLLK